ncbi:hypothetical protein COB28_02080 [Candidatus Dependentiae bacterium]|nr:MAG: hypothetical protein COB28_02080 [Candidatus Dependentiae bacterium]
MNMLMTLFPTSPYYECAWYSIVFLSGVIMGIIFPVPIKLSQPKYYENKYPYLVFIGSQCIILAIAAFSAHNNMIGYTSEYVKEINLYIGFALGIIGNMLVHLYYYCRSRTLSK